MKRIFYLLFLMISCTSLFAQEREWTNYTNLLSTKVLLHDGDDLWVGTTGGLVKFNKKTEAKFIYTKVNSALPNNAITALALDKNGALIIGTEGPHIVKFENNDWFVYDLSVFKISAGMQSFEVNDIVADRNNVLWVSIPGKGLLKYSENKWEMLTPENSGIKEDLIECMSVDSNNTLWLGTRDSGIVSYNATGWKNYTAANLEALPDRGINAIDVDIHNTVWFSSSWGSLIEFKNGTWNLHPTPPFCGTTYIANKIDVDIAGNVFIAGALNGVSKFDGKEWLYVFSNQGGGNTNTIATVAVDPATNFLWFGIEENSNRVAYRGVIRYTDTNFKNYNFSDIELPSNTINHILKDKDNVLWIATSAGVVKYDKNVWNPVPPKDLKYLSTTTNIAQAKNGDIWLSGLGGIARYDGETFKVSSFYAENEIPNDIAADSSGNILFTTSRYGLLQYDGKTWTVIDTTNSMIPSNLITSIATDKYGVIWIGTDKGLAKVDNSNWTVYKPTDFGITNDNISHITFDTSNTLWYSSDWKGGLVKFDGTSWNEYTSANSLLPENSITALMIDKQNRKWIGTRFSGLVLFNDIDWEVFNSENSGLISNYVTVISMDKDNNIWVGGDGGISFLKLNQKTGINDIVSSLGFTLQQSVPNPASDFTTIKYSILNKPAYVELAIYDAVGKKIKTLVNQQQISGDCEVWVDLNEFCTNTYFYQLNVDGKVQTKTMLILKNE